MENAVHNIEGKSFSLLSGVKRYIIKNVHLCIVVEQPVCSLAHQIVLPLRVTYEKHIIMKLEHFYVWNGSDFTYETPNSHVKWTLSKFKMLNFDLWNMYCAYEIEDSHVTINFIYGIKTCQIPFLYVKLHMKYLNILSVAIWIYISPNRFWHKLCLLRLVCRLFVHPIFIRRSSSTRSNWNNYAHQSFKCCFCQHWGLLSLTFIILNITWNCQTTNYPVLDTFLSSFGLKLSA